MNVLGNLAMKIRNPKKQHYLPVALTVILSVAAPEALAFKSYAEKGFVRVDNLKTDVTLLLADGKTVTLGEALPEYEPSWWGAPLPIDELELEGVQDVWRNLFQPFDYNQDNIFEKPEMAVFAIAMAAKNKGLDVMNVSVNGFIVTGLDVTSDQDYGLDALTLKVPARDVAAKERRQLMVEIETYFNVDLGGGVEGGGGD